MFSSPLLLLFVFCVLTCFAVDPEVNLQHACLGDSNRFGPFFPRELPRDMVNDLLRDLCGDNSMELPEAVILFLQRLEHPTLKVFLFAILWKKISPLIDHESAANSALSTEKTVTVSILKTNDRKSSQKKLKVQLPGVFSPAQIASYLNTEEMKIQFFSSLAGVDTQSSPNLIRVISHIMKSQNNHNSAFQEKASAAVTSIKESWGLLKSSLEELHDDVVEASVVQDLSFWVTECKNAAADMMEMMISAIKFIGIVLRMEQEGTSEGLLRLAKRHLLELYSFMHKRVRGTKTEMELASQSESDHIVFEFGPELSRSLTPDIKERISDIDKSAQVISIEIHATMKALMNECNINCVFNTPISAKSMMDIHLRIIQLFGEAIKALNAIELENMEPTQNPLLDIPERIPRLVFEFETNTRDKILILHELAFLSHAKGAAFLGAKFFELYERVDVTSLVEGYVKASKNTFIPISPSSSIHDEDWQFYFLANLDLGSMRKAYAASDSLVAMFNLKKVDFSVFPSNQENVQTWAIQKNLFFSQEMFFLEPFIEVSGNIAFSMLQALSNFVKYALQWRTTLIHMESMKSLHDRLVRGLDILERMDMEDTYFYDSEVGNQNMQVQPELENLRKKFLTLRKDLNAILSSISIELEGVPDFSIYAALLPILLSFVNLYMNFFFAGFPTALSSSAKLYTSK